MFIGIDGNEANVERRVGISEYAFETLLEFSKINSQNINFEIYLKDNPLSDLPKESLNWKYKVFGPKKAWTQIALPLRLFTQFKKPDLFFSPTHYAPRWSTIPTAISIMDLAFLRYPETFTKKDLYQLKNWTQYSVENASLIFTISESSKDDIIKFYKVDPKKIIVTYPGIKKELRIMNQELNFKDIREKYNISDNFILFVGTLQPRKNIAKLIEAFSLLKNKEKKLNLVIVGKKGWKYEDILSAPDKFGIKDSVRFLDFVPDDELNILYKNALCYCLPSLYEGFGLPILEAMKRGCPVITSNISSLPEAGGDAALYFNPNKASDIAKTIDRVINDKKLRDEMIKKGYEQIKKFSWEKSAKQALDAIVNLVENKNI